MLKSKKGGVLNLVERGGGGGEGGGQDGPRTIYGFQGLQIRSGPPKILSRGT